MGVVLRMPTSCTEAVQQHRGPGRYPKVIGQLRVAREKRSMVELKKAQWRQLETAELVREWSNALGYLEHVEGKFYALGLEPPHRGKLLDKSGRKPKDAQGERQ